MAIYHLSAQTSSRAASRSSVAAYRAGERLEDQRTGLIHDDKRDRHRDQDRDRHPGDAGGRGATPRRERTIDHDDDWCP